MKHDFTKPGFYRMRNGARAEVLAERDHMLVVAYKVGCHLTATTLHRDGLAIEGSGMSPTDLMEPWQEQPAEPIQKAANEKTLHAKLLWSLYPMLLEEHRAYASYIVDDFIDLVKVKCRLPRYRGKWTGSEHEESAYGGISDEADPPLAWDKFTAPGLYRMDCNSKADVLAERQGILIGFAAGVAMGWDRFGMPLGHPPEYKLVEPWDEAAERQRRIKDAAAYKTSNGGWLP